MIIIDKKKILMLLIGVFCFSTLLLTNMNKVENTVLTSTVSTVRTASRPASC